MAAAFGHRARPDARCELSFAVPFAQNPHDWATGDMGIAINPCKLLVVEDIEPDVEVLARTAQGGAIVYDSACADGGMICVSSAIQNGPSHSSDFALPEF